MPKNCPKCNKEWPDEFMACPLDGTPLVAKSQQPAGFSLNLGDANAISGGVNMSDNHSVSNNSVSNVDSHNVITNNITQVEREKTPEELKHERELAFRESCIETITNGILTSEGKRKLDDLQCRLGIDETSAARIISEVSKRSERKSATLSPVHQITYNNIKTAILANRLDIVNRLLMQLKAMVQRYSAEEIQYTYYMLQSILHPEVCISEFESHHEDKYWQSFWSSVAYRRKGNIEKSELLVADVGDKWIDTIPQDNVWILASVNAMIDNDIESAKSLYDNITGEHSPLLSNLATSLYTLLYSDMLEAEDLKQMQKDSQFYTNNLFAGIKEQENERACQQEEMRLKKEAEVKRKAAEEEKQRQEAEKRRSSKEALLKDVNDKKVATIGQPDAHAYILDRDSAPKDENLTAEQLLEKALSIEGPDRIPLLKKASEKGSTEAMYRLACRYLKGDWVDKDLYKAFSYMQRAAEANHIKAMANLGVMYKRGLGTKANENNAIEWLKKAAIQKDEQAIALLNVIGIAIEDNNVRNTKSAAKENFENNVQPTTNEPTAHVNNAWVTQDNNYGFVLNLTLEFKNVKSCELACSIDTAISSYKYDEKKLLFNSSYRLSMSTPNDTINYQIRLSVKELHDNLKYKPDVLIGLVSNFEVKNTTQILAKYTYDFNVLYEWHMFSDSKIFLK